jgi:hypothetical protein
MEGSGTVMDLETHIGGLGECARHDSLTLLRQARRDDWNVELVEKVLRDLVGDVLRWKESWANEKVTRDREVRAASDRALDCTAHGRVISDLEKQVHHFDESYRGADAARVALVGGYWNLRDILTTLRKQIADGGRAPATDRLLDSIIAVLSEALDDSGRAMDNPPKRRPAQAKLAKVAGVDQ